MKEHPHLPCVAEAANSCGVQPHYNGKETVEIPLCFTARTDEGSTRVSLSQQGRSSTA